MNMPHNPPVTFIVIAFNEEFAIEKCLSSILSQKYEGKTSIIIVNDASTDHTANIVLRMAEIFPNILLINNEKNMGRGYSRKIGVEMSVDSYIAFVDADIQVPNNWLSTCLCEIENFDACGGIAVPDGDTQYVYTKYKLNPKVKKHTVSVSGGNGLYKRRVFEQVKFNSQMRDGEDVDFIWRATAAGLKFKSIQRLIVEHREYKSFYSSVKWLFESGVGANKLFWKYRNVRLPDASFLVFIFLTISSLVAILQTGSRLYVAGPALYLWLVSAVHLWRSYYVNDLRIFVFASITHSVFIAAYFFGRLTALVAFKT